jgi:hypothetical protein
VEPIAAYHAAAQAVVGEIGQQTAAILARVARGSVAAVAGRRRSAVLPVLQREAREAIMARLEW